MTREEFYRKWNPGGTFNNPHAEHNKDVLDNVDTYKEFMNDIEEMIEAVQQGVAVLIAVGGNDLMVPCRIFGDLETGKQICDEILGIEGKPSKSGDVIRYEIDLENDDEGGVISEQLFTRFYYGCGGVYSFILREVPFNTKFVGFDLD